MVLVIVCVNCVKTIFTSKGLRWKIQVPLAHSPLLGLKIQSSNQIVYCVCFIFLLGFAGSCSIGTTQPRCRNGIKKPNPRSFCSREFRQHYMRHCTVWFVVTRYNPIKLVWSSKWQFFPWLTTVIDLNEVLILKD